MLVVCLSVHFILLKTPVALGVTADLCDYARFLGNYVLLSGSCLVQVLCEACKAEKRSVAFPLFHEFVHRVSLYS